MTKRVYNFSAGPATLPEEVLNKVQGELLDYKGHGMSVMEMSHRSEPIKSIVDETESLVKELLNISDKYKVLFMQGGASSQFYMIPQNILKPDQTASYILTGSFAKKAYEEAVKIGNIKVAADMKAEKYTRLPNENELDFDSNNAYIHLTTNNTIYGTQWGSMPETSGIPIAADMSSDIMSRPIDMTNIGIIYAGAQKNLGPAGVTLVVIRKDLMENVPESLPNMNRYDVIAEADSLFNTPPVFAIYVMKLVLEWIKNMGGLNKIHEINKEKANYIYEVIDESDGFYKGHAKKEDRSLMNVPFRLKDEDLEKRFLQEAEKNELVGLKGHRSVGGIRASIYNAMPVEGCKALAEFMKDFCQKNK
ncbi:3-phosphoserine/phosphohydroxythreonine transaminase [Natranaerofaba carboxydovora]|uniref:3-phosphoserine/phosphohydroxythreonine transaminase n=1 Tax=Natranaerofaba carboxydovora TaxID=2742683 RepID=UPI001F1341E4|nr:3-phosphoserine/phosphohydroxythreonine transaminase [Natranaerofaba carboxydovora]UMZ72923.1 Phosphoserine aminotransferase [Natranaerofaba carboxydovora]